MVKQMILSTLTTNLYLLWRKYMVQEQLERLVLHLKGSEEHTGVFRVIKTVSPCCSVHILAPHSKGLEKFFTFTGKKWKEK